MNPVEKKTLTTDKRSDDTAMLLLRISMGVVYLWFGALKFFNGVSPAEGLAMHTIHKLTFGLINDHTNLFLLAIWESLIGILLITGKYVKTALYLLFPHILCTFMPFILSPKDTLGFPPLGLTLVGQYIVKNIVIISAALVIWKAETANEALVSQKHNGSGHS